LRYFFYNKAMFRTELTPEIAASGISHYNGIFAIGSCFAEHIGGRLQAAKFKTSINPFGILYNPASIAYSLERLWEGRTYTQEDLFENQGIWHSFDHHGRLSSHNPELALHNINEALRLGSEALHRANRLLITLGTANVFVWKEERRIVANCHKLPGTAFDKYRLSVNEVIDLLSPVFERLHQAQPQLHIVLSVSPVRHLRDGFVENQRSKATLLLATEALCRRHDFAHYFPAYELLMDDLRDYRFYDTDMIHPSSQAIDYIWERFSDSYFSPQTRQLMTAVKKISEAAAHRPFHPDSEPHRRFLEKLCLDIEAMEQEHPFLNFSDEKARILTNSQP